MARLSWRRTKPLIKNAWLVVVGPTVVGVAIVAIVTVWHPWSAASLTRTEIRLLAADPGTGLPPAVKATATAAGVCEYPSLEDPVVDAYRCGGGNVIYDPCFGQDRSRVICIETPWSTVGVRFKVSRFEWYTRGRLLIWRPGAAVPPGLQVVPPDPTTEMHPPWALELATGLRCVFVGGAIFSVANQRANYDCGANGFSGDRGPWIIGIPDRSTEPWVVSLLPAVSSKTTQVAVRVAWY